MVRQVTEEERQFIADLAQNKGIKGKQAIALFQQKYDWIPSATSMNRYQSYSIKEGGDDNGDNDDNGEDGEIEHVEVEKGETKKKGEIYDFSDGEIPDDTFDKIVRVSGHDKATVFNYLKTALSRGYKKIDLNTGELSK